MSLNLIKPSSSASRKLHLMHFIIFSKFQHFHSLVFDPLGGWCGKSTNVLLRPVVQIFVSIQNLTSLKTSLHVLYHCHFPLMIPPFYFCSLFFFIPSPSFFLYQKKNDPVHARMCALSVFFLMIIGALGFFQENSKENSPLASSEGILLSWVQLGLMSMSWQGGGMV